MKTVVMVMVLGYSACVRAQTPSPDSVMFQGFNWASSENPSWYGVLQNIAKDVADAGITDVWFPPPSQSAAPQGYLPGKLYDLDSSKYGTEAQLKQAIDAFRQRGVRSMADMVINHRTGSKQDDKGNWCIFEGGTDDDRLDWGTWAVPPGDEPYPSCGTGNADTGTHFDGAPDIDHTNPRVQKELSEWMNWLKTEIGFSGWRFDFGRGYRADILGKYIESTSPAFAVGEVWDTLTIGEEDAHRRKLVDWVHSTGDRSTAFDFTTKGVLQHALQNNELWRMKDSNGKPSGFIGVMPEKAVTFIDNHDTGSQKIWPFPYEKVAEGYVYILTHPGVPCVFYDHFVDGNFKEGIKALLSIRKRNGIKANSACEILTAENDLYMANIDNKVIMKIGPKLDLGKFLPDPEYFNLATNGDGYAVWEKKA